MVGRRQVLHGGLGALSLGLLAAHAHGRNALAMRGNSGGWGGAWSDGDRRLIGSRPVSRVRRFEPLVDVRGYPFLESFLGDGFANDAIPFHGSEDDFPTGEPPEPTETVDVAIVGGGISGLAMGYLLRRFRPVLFELQDRFGGVSRGEQWGGTKFSYGGAYVITPDEGGFLERFYGLLDLPDVVRVDEGDAEVRIGGAFSQDDFWSGAGLGRDERRAFRKYARIVRRMANRDYPEIPLPDEDFEWILDLDRVTLRADIESQMGDVVVPPALAAAIQAYCYSSFSAGWEEISAASGWNFLAAEEFGRWVFPGGNAYMVDQLWRKLAMLERRTPHNVAPRHLRAGCRVVDVRLREDGTSQVTYKDADGSFGSMIAKHVVMACSKHIAKYIVRDLERIDPDKLNAMHTIQTRAYVVANVLLDEPVERDYYDVFLLGEDGSGYPMDAGSVERWREVTDVLNGEYARRRSSPRSVLTLYWPLPFETARFQLIDEFGWEDFATSLASQLGEILDAFEVSRESVRQVRMVRWGHAMPLPVPDFIAGGRAAEVQRPIRDSVWFVNQDNWALPAVENCLLDARSTARRIAALLR